MSKINTQSHYGRRSFLNTSAKIVGLGLLQRSLGGFAASNDEVGNMRMTVGFKMENLGPRALRPYLAIWVEDTQGQMVYTVALWVDKKEKERNRWVDNLRRFFRTVERQGKGQALQLSQTTSSATRSPGEYTVSWNCQGADGKALKEGDYVLCIETAREKGRYNLDKQVFKLNNKKQAKTVIPDVLEMSDVFYSLEQA